MRGPQIPPAAPDFTARDLVSVQRVAAASARDDGYRKPLAAYCNMVRRDATGRVVGPVTPPAISAKLLAGLQPSDYARIHAPALGKPSKTNPVFIMTHAGPCVLLRDVIE